MKLRHPITSIALVFLLIADVCSMDNAILKQTPAPIKKILKKHRVKQGNFSLYVKEIGVTQPWFTLNADILRNPASAMKVLTTFAGLDLLGPNYTWHTNFYLDGKMDKNALYGNLIMQGGGDPFLSKENLWHTVFTLQSKGLRHILGDFLIDNGAFEQEWGSAGDFDKQPYRAYNVLPVPTLVNFKAHQFHFSMQQGALHIYADPPSTTLKINNRVKLTKATCGGNNLRIGQQITQKADHTVVTFSGKYPAKCSSYSMLLSVSPNEQYIYGLFKSLWQEMGGVISGNVGSIENYQGKPFHKVSSRPLSQMITYINKHSNNVMARQLFLTIGKQQTESKGQKIPGNKALSQQIIYEWLATIGIPKHRLVLDNGSGLSRISRISARALGELLEYAYYSPYQPEFMASLPMVGVDGTVRKRLKSLIPAGKIRLKTGYLKDTRAMAGYVHSRSGRRYIVVALQNGIQGSTQIQDTVLVWLYAQ